MENKELKISSENALSAYKNADANGRKLLENLFSKEVFAPKNVMEQVKTFEDACCELGENHPLVKSYEALCSVDTDKDIEAYAKLRIIAAALNNGWKPKLTEDGRRWFPWFYLYTQGEIDKMSEDDKARLWYIGSCSSDGVFFGLDSSYSYLS